MARRRVGLLGFRFSLHWSEKQMRRIIENIRNQIADGVIREDSGSLPSANFVIQVCRR
jgi:hypothetical protein